MKKFQIHSTTGRILFEGRFSSRRACVEKAVEDRVRLDGAKLARADLSNAMLDDGLLDGADFSGTNLTGANLSEASLRGVNFISADLYNACLAYADLRGCRFDNAGFGATDVAGCDLSGSVFSGSACFSLPFVSCGDMAGCSYINDDGLKAAMTQPPMVVYGLSHEKIIVMDQYVKIGPDLFALEARPSERQVKRLFGGHAC